ncbi:MAG: Mur ligase family protein [Deltaproteobacteria bacterium]|nr:Mur ligase family protein [Deltaproteobacteria bacterium]
MVVTGSHGKSTTTAMITTVVQNFYGGSYYIGAKFLQDGRYAKFDSQSEWAIIEADESDGLFLKNRADIGVVTVSDSEHLDFWRSKRVLDLAFYSFILTCKELCILGQEFWFNFAWEKSKINSVKTKVCSINLGPEGTEYHISIDDRDLFGFIPFWGEHYVKNLAIALAVCRRLGICEHDAADILKNYRGLSRRMEVLSRNPLIISDYAHHPSEVKVTIEALSSVFDKLVVFYQPHRLSRIKKTFSEHRGLFLKCSKAFVLPVFEPNNFSGEILMKEESLEFGKQLSEISGATFIENFEETLRKFISERSWQIVVLGAGDIDERTRVISSRIVSAA